VGPDGYRRNAVAASLIAELCSALARYGAEGLAPFVGSWRMLDAYLGEPVELITGERRIAGIHAGIDADGSLLLQSDGRVSAYQAGEVSLRPRPL